MSSREQATSERERIDALADDIALCAARLHCVEHELLTHIRRFDELKGWARQGSRSAAAWLSWRIGIGPLAAREKVRTAVALGRLPKMDAALSRGESRQKWGKVRAMTRVADADNEELLLTHKLAAPPAPSSSASAPAFARSCAARSWTKIIGTCAGGSCRTGPCRSRCASCPTRPSECGKPSQTSATPSRHARPQPSSPTENENDRSGRVSAGTGQPPTMADAAIAMAERTLADMGAHDASGADRHLLFVHLSEQLSPAHASDSTTHAPWKAELQCGTAIHGESLLRLACDSWFVFPSRASAAGGALADRAVRWRG